MPVPESFDFSHLSIAERIDLVELLWDSIAKDATAESMPLTVPQEQELDRRLAADAAGELTEHAWPEVRKWLEQDDE